MGGVRETALRLVPEWVPREENTLADKLSKAWEQWYLLCPKALGRVHGLIAEAKHSTHRAARVVNVPFNQIRNVLHHAKEESSVICLVHPLWHAQSWWEIVRESEVAYRWVRYKTPWYRRLTTAHGRVGRGGGWTRPFSISARERLGHEPLWGGRDASVGEYE